VAAACFNGVSLPAFLLNGGHFSSSEDSASYEDTLKHMGGRECLNAKSFWPAFGSRSCQQIRAVCASLLTSTIALRKVIEKKKVIL
jgi:hypothetical protein